MTDPAESADGGSAAGDGGLAESALADAYVDELAQRWYDLLESAIDEGSVGDDRTAAAQGRLIDWLAIASDVEEAELALSSGILSFVEELDEKEDFLASVVLREAGRLCRSIARPTFAELVLELAEVLMARIPDAVLDSLDLFGAQLASDARLLDELFEGAPPARLDWLSGRAWLELEDAGRARERFVRAHEVAGASERSVLEYLIANCTSELGEVDEAADWILRAIASAEEAGEELDAELVESAGELVLAALAVSPPAISRVAAYERFRDVYLAHPDWFVPIAGEALYLAAAAEIHEDRVEWAAATELVERARALADGEDVSPEDRAEVALTWARIAITSGRVSHGLTAIRHASAAVALGTPDQQAKLSALAAGVMSSLGQGDPARQELQRLAVPRVDRWADVDGSAEQRVGFAVGIAEDVAALIADTQVRLGEPAATAGLAHRWLALTDRVPRLDGGEAVGVHFLRIAAATAQASGQRSLAAVLMQRLEDLEQAWAGARGEVAGERPFARFLASIAHGDVGEVVTGAADLVDESQASNDLLYVLGTAMQVIARRAAGAAPADVFAAACVALRTHSLWRSQLPSSVERLAFDARLELVLPPIYEAVAGLEQPRLIAEFIEFSRSQAMPEAQASADVSSVSMQRLLRGLGSPDQLGADGALALDDEVIVGRSGQVRMPWGTLALAEFLEPTDDPVVELDVPC